MKMDGDIDEDMDCCKLRSLESAGIEPCRRKGTKIEFERAGDEIAPPIPSIRQMGAPGVFNSYQDPAKRTK